MGPVGILARVAQRLALTQQIPELVKLEADLLQTLAVLVEAGIGRPLPAAQFLALGLESLDDLVDLFVGRHGAQYLRSLTEDLSDDLRGLRSAA
jgi:hypothetical protein